MKLGLHEFSDHEAEAKSHLQSPVPSDLHSQAPHPNLSRASQKLQYLGTMCLKHEPVRTLQIIQETPTAERAG